jgi:hypothetical protein
MATRRAAGPAADSTASASSAAALSAARRAAARPSAARRVSSCRIRPPCRRMCASTTAAAPAASHGPSNARRHSRSARAGGGRQPPTSLPSSGGKAETAARVDCIARASSASTKAGQRLVQGVVESLRPCATACRSRGAGGWAPLPRRGALRRRARGRPAAAARARRAAAMVPPTADAPGRHVPMPECFCTPLAHQTI